MAVGVEATLLAGAGVAGLAIVGMIANRDVRRLEQDVPQPTVPSNGRRRLVAPPTRLVTRRHVRPFER